MKLRWFAIKKIITADMVREYAEKHSISMMTAKQELGKSNTDIILQYRTWYGKWVNVPHVTEYIN